MACLLGAVWDLEVLKDVLAVFHLRCYWILFNK